MTAYNQSWEGKTMATTVTKNILEKIRNIEPVNFSLHLEIKEENLGTGLDCIYLHHLQLGGATWL